MGRKRFGGFRKKQQLKANLMDPSQQINSRDTQKPYNDIIRENDKFIKYYQMQNICKEEDFDDFIRVLKTDLPTTFRITGSKTVASKMLEIVEKQLINNCVNQIGDEKLPDIFPLPWYPNKLAWQMNLTRKDIRRCEAYYKLHNFLISETENGTISRQEAVSMIPPLVLDVQPHHKVLDMCAAPGSKTAQLLELLHANDDPIPSGYVIANDVDNKRCYMLVHQAKRLNSPCIAVINHDSTILPNLFATLPDGSVKQVQFDRILCDVPCSGDGTLRKNPDIWLKWTAANGLNLHGIQSKILKRGVELLTIGGKLVYSTCSLNPIENEAVIHRLLCDTNGALELVDVSDTLTGLKYNPGLEDWLVCSRNLEFFKDFDNVDDKWRTTIRPDMFPPKPEDKMKFHLNRCVRILPHQQNTGAFFVAVIKKLRPLSTKDISVNVDNVKVENTCTKESKKRNNEDDVLGQRKRRKQIYNEDPFVFFQENEPVWNDIKSFYNIADDFNSKCLLTRCHVGKKKNIYLTSELIRDLVIKNQGIIKFINTGVKAFVRCDNKNMKCAFRIANDGLESVYPYIGNGRKLYVSKDDLVRLLSNDDPHHSPTIDSLTKNVQLQVENLDPGSCVLIYKEDASVNPLLIYMSGWRGTTSLRCYLDRNSTLHLLRLLGGDISKYDINKFQNLADKHQEKDEDIDGLVQTETRE